MHCTQLLLLALCSFVLYSQAKRVAHYSFDQLPLEEVKLDTCRILLEAGTGLYERCVKHFWHVGHYWGQDSLLLQYFYRAGPTDNDGSMYLSPNHRHVKLHQEAPLPKGLYAFQLCVSDWHTFAPPLFVNFTVQINTSH